MILDKLNLGEFWRKQELANQFVHFFFGFWMSYYMWLVGFGKISLIGFSIPFLIELFRQVTLEDPEYILSYLLDKIRDCFFYFLGSLATLILVKFPIG